MFRDLQVKLAIQIFATALESYNGAIKTTLIATAMPLKISELSYLSCSDSAGHSLLQ